MRRRRSILDLPSSSERDAEVEFPHDLDIPDYARPGQPMTFRRWIRMVFGPGSLAGCNRPQNQMMLGSWALFVIVGLLIPETILEHEWARNFCDFMASIVPQIDRVTDLGLRPEVNRFHYSLLWAFAPIYGVWFVATVEKSCAHAKVRMAPFDALRYGLGCAAFAVAFMFVVFGWFGDPQDSREAQGLFGNVVGRAFWAPLYVGATIMFTVLTFVCSRLMIAGILIKRKECSNDG